MIVAIKKVRRPSILSRVIKHHAPLVGHITFALIAIGLLTLICVEAEIRLSGGDILVLTQLKEQASICLLCE
jgi:hypothetical protein